MSGSFSPGVQLYAIRDERHCVSGNPGNEVYGILVDAPDLPTGGQLLYDAAAMTEIYNTGRGSFKVRAKWRYSKKENLIEVFEIPYSTTIEAIMENWRRRRTHSVRQEIHSFRMSRTPSTFGINLMAGFGLDQVQAEYVADIRLRNINKEYILKRVREEESLRDEIDDLEAGAASPSFCSA